MLARSFLLLSLVSLLASAAFACETETATTAVVDNAYAPDSGAATVVVYKVWWQTTLFAQSVAPGTSSETERVAPATDTAFAVLAPGWDPASGAAPGRLVAVQSRSALSVERGGLLHVRVSPDTFVGDCAAGADRLTQEQADFITQRIFPAEFAGVAYAASDCRVTRAVDGGADGAPDAEAGD